LSKREGTNRLEGVWGCCVSGLGTQHGGGSLADALYLYDGVNCHRHCIICNTIRAEPCGGLTLQDRWNVIMACGPGHLVT
jgi:hypothetical protein